jgi:hypothetical protein
MRLLGSILNLAFAGIRLALSGVVAWTTWEVPVKFFITPPDPPWIEYAGLYPFLVPRYPEEGVRIGWRLKLVEVFDVHFPVEILETLRDQVRCNHSPLVAVPEDLLRLMLPAGQPWPVRLTSDPITLGRAYPPMWSGVPGVLASREPRRWHDPCLAALDHDPVRVSCVAYARVFLPGDRGRDLLLHMQRPRGWPGPPVASLFGGALREDGEDLRRTVPLAELPRFLAWFLFRLGRETSVLRELEEELVHETGALAAAAWSALVDPRTGPGDAA